MAGGSVKPAGSLSIRVIRGKPPKRPKFSTILRRLLPWP